MNRRPFRIVAVTTALGLLIVVLITLRADGQQSAMPRTLEAQVPITYFIADGSGQTGYRSSDRELARWAFDAWQRSAGENLRFQAASESNARVRLYWAEPSDGQYGEMRPLVVGGQRGAALFIRPDVESLGPD